MKYADPEAQKEIDRLQEKLTEMRRQLKQLDLEFRNLEVVSRRIVDLVDELLDTAG